MLLVNVLVEGRTDGSYGYTILVTNFDFGSGGGVLDETTGKAHFKVTFKSVVFRPFKNEVLPAEVIVVNQNGFFAQAGPLSIFVSKLLMHEEFKFDSHESMPAYVSDDGELRIATGSMVLIKIVGIRLPITDDHVIGTIKHDYLGPMEMS